MLLEPCRPHHKQIFFCLFLLFSWQIFCGKAKNVSVYYLPRTDEVDRSVITCVKRIFLIHSPFLYKRQKSESSDAWVFLIRIVGGTFVNFFSSFGIYFNSFESVCVRNPSWSYVTETRNDPDERERKRVILSGPRRQNWFLWRSTEFIVNFKSSPATLFKFH